MELRHLRYFIAVAEEGSLTNAAERRLHTAQPSLSRQIRDLELEVGVKLLERGARGINLTAAGRVFVVWMVGAEGDNRLHGFRGDTGEALFGTEAGPAMSGLHHFQTLIANKDRIFVGADGRIYAFVF
jgi:hypothetical protein